MKLDKLLTAFSTAVAAMAAVLAAILGIGWLVLTVHPLLGIGIFVFVTVFVCCLIED